MLLFWKLIDKTQMPKPQLFLVSLQGLQSVSNLVESPAPVMESNFMNLKGKNHFNILGDIKQKRTMCCSSYEPQLACQLLYIDCWELLWLPRLLLHSKVFAKNRSVKILHRKLANLLSHKNTALLIVIWREICAIIKCKLDFTKCARCSSNYFSCQITKCSF